jgi:hypothetical protein
MKTAWFFTLIAAICFEGLGRRYLPQVPSAVFYFLKDVVLVYGLVKYRPPLSIWRVTGKLYGAFAIIALIALVWTFLEVFNPDHQSVALAALGFRAYWLWWLAPPLIAHVLRDPKERSRAMYGLLATSAVVAILAAAQFAAPADSSINVYSYVDGEQTEGAIVYSTGRARVASTFSFLSGFADFTILIPTLTLSFGLDARDPRLRRTALIVTGLTAATIPMAGSRASLLIAGTILLVSVWTAGLFKTRIGRRILVGALVAAVVSVTVFPDAFLGVRSRFADEEETNSRYLLMATAVLPPLAIGMLDHPPLGVGTGMQQNARVRMGIADSYVQEVESGRYLVELGTFGYLVVWTAKLGLMVALVRAYKLLRRAGRRGAATASLSYAVLTMAGSLTFDHVWQALYFVGCGFILAEVLSVLRARAAVAPVPEPMPIGALAAR